jgi:hypothetical protein
LNIRGYLVNTLYNNSQAKGFQPQCITNMEISMYGLWKHNGITKRNNPCAEDLKFTLAHDLNAVQSLATWPIQQNYHLSKPCIYDWKHTEGVLRGTASIYLNVTKALWFRCSQQNKITWYFFILSNPNYVTNTDILSLNLCLQKLESYL